ncbi:hypothetical protein EB796_021963 [Bugula neritina]|uniref:Uncharacterized protein n=1 Tax=Bugula neritina TaxID=10212 RepID=A0A7J7J0X9_BUGNE|nr:hypothetical protein EB796_021963 [Bugula neritina]
MPLTVTQLLICLNHSFTYCLGWLASVSLGEKAAIENSWDCNMLQQQITWMINQEITLFFIDYLYTLYFVIYFNVINNLYFKVFTTEQ